MGCPDSGGRRCHAHRVAAVVDGHGSKGWRRDKPFETDNGRGYGIAFNPACLTGHSAVGGPGFRPDELHHEAVLVGQPIITFLPLLERLIDRLRQGLEPLAVSIDRDPQWGAIVDKHVEIPRRDHLALEGHGCRRLVGVKGMRSHDPKPRGGITVIEPPDQARGQAWNPLMVEGPHHGRKLVDPLGQAGQPAFRLGLAAREGCEDRIRFVRTRAETAGGAHPVA